MSSNTFTLAATVAAGLFASTASAAFNPVASTNVAMYWGQGDSQIPLSQVCNDASIDIVNIAFVNQFPLTVGDYPATNFANACGDGTFTKPDGTKSGLLSNCPTIGPAIMECQTNGKKVLLSVGGGYPTNYTLPSVEVAEYFADFLWGAFGPSTAAWVDAGKPRPFGDVSVDGFDLDIESLISPAPFPDYLFANYDKFVTRLKTVAFPTGPGSYYISAAPQCQVPDTRLADAISKSHFDFIFAQFYNTAQCNTRAGYNGLSTSTTAFTYSTWVDWLKANSFNSAVKLYLGMPAGVNGAPYDPTAALTITEANALLKFYKAKHPDIFGGAMLWEATVSAVNNTKCGKGYSVWIKSVLLGTFTNEVCPSSSSTIASSTSRPVSSTSSSAIPTQTATIPTPDGTCGINGYTCLGYVLGECCSPYGYCGSTADHCGTGCQAGSGKCGIQSSSSSVAVSSTIASSRSSSAVVPPTSTRSSSVVVSSTAISSIVISSTVILPTVISSTIRPSSTVISSTIRPSSTVVSSTIISSTIRSSSTVVSSTVISSTIRPSSTVISSTIRPSSTLISSTISPLSTVISSTIRPSSTVVSTTIRPSSTLGTSTRSSTPVATPTKAVSSDGTCGGTGAFTCKGSSFGNCCSSSGWCGATDAYCGTGCNSAFGTCTGAAVSSVQPSVVSTVKPSTLVTSTKTSSAAVPSATKKVSTDATCGGTGGFTCQGSAFGNCCSNSGWCGATTAYCGTGCNQLFGTCT